MEDGSGECGALVQTGFDPEVKVSGAGVGIYSIVST